MTRGFSRRLISGDDTASELKRGCAGQDDEVVGTDVNVLRLEHHYGFRALRDDLLKRDSLANIAISQSRLKSVSAEARRAILDNRCLWEKLEPLSGERVLAKRNYLVVDRSQSGAAQVRLWQERPYRLPAGQSQPADGSHFWFIRAGHLIGERWNGISFEPLPGLMGLSEVLFSTGSQRWTRDSVSEQEFYDEPTGGADPTVCAPNQNWGLLNQICLFQGISLSPACIFELRAGDDR